MAIYPDLSICLSLILIPVKKDHGEKSIAKAFIKTERQGGSIQLFLSWLTLDESFTLWTFISQAIERKATRLD